ALHTLHRMGDERNFHAHILTTTRQIEATGLGAKTSIEWSETDRAKWGLGSGKEEIAEIRERWAVLTNEKLQTLGHEARIDHRSLEAQGIELEPTVHLGPAVSGMERRGIATEVGERIKAEVQARLELAAEIGRLQREIEQVNRSIIELSTDIRAALATRNTGLSQWAAMRAEAGPKQTIEQMREAAREQWLEYREQQAGKGMDMGQEADTEAIPGRQQGHDIADDDFSL
ncbi:MAG TPA: MobA/MobL family protein, partial [Steroidobacteraceae bacterium]